MHICWSFSLFLVLSASLAKGGSATWGINPASGDWNTAANWTPNAVPNGPLDIASLGVSSVSDLSIHSSIVEVEGIVFNSGATPYTISVEVSNLFLSGRGVVNNSGSVQSFVTPITENNNGAVFFFNTATAGEMTSFGGEGGLFVFQDSSSAGSAVFDVTSGGIFQAFMSFSGNSTAADATINVKFGDVSVYENATAGNAVFSVSSGATLFIADNATADHATATCMGGNGMASSIDFQQFGSAGEGHFAAMGASTIGEAGSDIEFTSSATAANGTFVINGGTAPDLAGAFMTFRDTTTADNATITANGGNGAGGGSIIFKDLSQGGTARISVFGNGQLSIKNTRAPVVTLGSLAGDGLVVLRPMSNQAKKTMCN